MKIPFFNKPKKDIQPPQPEVPTATIKLLEALKVNQETKLVKIKKAVAEQIGALIVSGDLTTEKGQELISQLEDFHNQNAGQSQKKSVYRQGLKNLIEQSFGLAIPPAEANDTKEQTNEIKNPIETEPVNQDLTKSTEVGVDLESAKKSMAEKEKIVAGQTQTAESANLDIQKQAAEFPDSPEVNNATAEVEQTLAEVKQKAVLFKTAVSAVRNPFFTFKQKSIEKINQDPSTDIEASTDKESAEKFAEQDNTHREILVKTADLLRKDIITGEQADEIYRQAIEIWDRHNNSASGANSIKFAEKMFELNELLNESQKTTEQNKSEEETPKGEPFSTEVIADNNEQTPEDKLEAEAPPSGEVTPKNIINLEKATLVPTVVEQEVPVETPAALEEQQPVDLSAMQSKIESLNNQSPFKRELADFLSVLQSSENQKIADLQRRLQLLAGDLEFLTDNEQADFSDSKEARELWSEKYFNELDQKGFLYKEVDKRRQDWYALENNIDAMVKNDYDNIDKFSSQTGEAMRQIVKENVADISALRNILEQANKLPDPAAVENQTPSATASMETPAAESAGQNKEIKEQRERILNAVNYVLMLVKEKAESLTPGPEYDRLSWLINSVKNSLDNDNKDANGRIEVKTQKGGPQREGIPVEGLLDFINKELAVLKEKIDDQEAKKKLAEFKEYYELIISNSKDYFYIRPGMRDQKQHWRTELEAFLISQDYRDTGDALKNYQLAMAVMSQRRELVLPAYAAEPVKKVQPAAVKESTPVIPVEPPEPSPGEKQPAVKKLYDLAKESLSQKLGYIDISPEDIFNKLTQEELTGLQAMIKNHEDREITDFFKNKISMLAKEQGISNLAEEQIQASAENVQRIIQKFIEERAREELAKFDAKKAGKIGWGMLKNVAVMAGTTAAIAVLGFTTAGIGVAAGISIASLAYRKLEENKRKKNADNNQEKFNKALVEKSEQILADLFAKPENNVKAKISAAISNEIRRQTSAGAINSINSYNQAVEKGQVDQAAEQLDKIEQELYDSALSMIKAHNRDLPLSDQQHMAVLMAMTLAQHQRGEHEAIAGFAEAKKLPKFMQAIKKFQALRIGKSDEQPPDEVTKSAWEKYKYDILSVAIGTGIGAAVRTNNTARVISGVLSGLTAGVAFSEWQGGRAERKTLQEIEAMITESEGKIKDIEFPSNQLETLRSNAAYVQSKLALGLFEHDPLLKTRAENFIHNVKQVELKNQEILEKLFKEQAENRQKLDKQIQTDVAKLEKASKTRRLTAMVGFGLAGGLAGAAFTDYGKEFIQDTIGVDLEAVKKENFNKIELPPSEFKVPEVDTSEKFDDLADAEAIQSSATEEIIIAEPPQAKIEKVIKVGQGQADKFLEHVIHRSVINGMSDEQIKALAADQTQDAIEAARQLNIAANLRELLTGAKSMAGVKASELTGVAEWNEAKGEFIVHDQVKFNGIVQRLSDRAVIKIGSQSDALAYTDDISKARWQAMLNERLTQMNDKSQPVINIQDYEADEKVRSAEHRVFANSMKAQFGEGITVDHIINESAGQVKGFHGIDQLNISNGRVVEITVGGQSLQNLNVPLDDDLSDNLVNEQIKAAGFTDLSVAHGLAARSGLISKDDLTFSPSDSEVLKIIQTRNISDPGVVNHLLNVNPQASQSVFFENLKYTEELINFSMSHQEMNEPALRQLLTNRNTAFTEVLKVNLDLDKYWQLEGRWEIKPQVLEIGSENINGVMLTGRAAAGCDGVKLFVRPSVDNTLTVCDGNADQPITSSITGDRVSLVFPNKPEELPGRLNTAYQDVDLKARTLVQIDEGLSQDAKARWLGKSFDYANQKENLMAVKMSAILGEDKIPTKEDFIKAVAEATESSQKDDIGEMYNAIFGGYEKAVLESADHARTPVNITENESLGQFIDKMAVPTKAISHIEAGEALDQNDAARVASNLQFNLSANEASDLSNGNINIQQTENGLQFIHPQGDNPENYESLAVVSVSKAETGDNIIVKSLLYSPDGRLTGNGPLMPVTAEFSPINLTAANIADALADIRRHAEAVAINQSIDNDVIRTYYQDNFEQIRTLQKEGYSFNYDTDKNELIVLKSDGDELNRIDVSGAGQKEELLTGKLLEPKPLPIVEQVATNLKTVFTPETATGLESQGYKMEYATNGALIVEKIDGVNRIFIIISKDCKFTSAFIASGEKSGKILAQGDFNLNDADGISAKDVNDLYAEAQRKIAEIKVQPASSGVTNYETMQNPLAGLKSNNVEIESVKITPDASGKVTVVVDYEGATHKNATIEIPASDLSGKDLAAQQAIIQSKIEGLMPEKIEVQPTMPAAVNYEIMQTPLAGLKSNGINIEKVAITKEANGNLTVAVEYDGESYKNATIEISASELADKDAIGQQAIIQSKIEVLSPEMAIVAPDDNIPSIILNLKAAHTSSVSNIEISEPDPANNNVRIASVTFNGINEPVAIEVPADQVDVQEYLNTHIKVEEAEIATDALKMLEDEKYGKLETDLQSYNDKVVKVEIADPDDNKTRKVTVTYQGVIAPQIIELPDSVNNPEAFIKGQIDEHLRRAEMNIFSSETDTSTFINNLNEKFPGRNIVNDGDGYLVFNKQSSPDGLCDAISTNGLKQAEIVDKIVSYDRLESAIKAQNPKITDLSFREIEDFVYAIVNGDKEKVLKLDLSAKDQFNSLIQEGVKKWFPDELTTSQAMEMIDYNIQVQNSILKGLDNLITGSDISNLPEKLLPEQSMQLKIALLSFKTMLLEDAQTPQKSYMITPENLSRLEGLVETAEKYDLMKEIVPDSSGRTASYKNMHDYIDELKSRNTPRVASQ